MSIKRLTKIIIRRLHESCLQTAGKEQHQRICTRNGIFPSYRDFREKWSLINISNAMLTLLTESY